MKIYDVWIYDEISDCHYSTVCSANSLEEAKQEGLQYIETWRLRRGKITRIEERQRYMKVNLGSTCFQCPHLKILASKDYSNIGRSALIGCEIKAYDSLLQPNQSCEYVEEKKKMSKITESKRSERIAREVQKIRAEKAREFGSVGQHYDCIFTGIDGCGLLTDAICSDRVCQFYISKRHSAKRKGGEK